MTSATPPLTAKVKVPIALVEDDHADAMLLEKVASKAWPEARIVRFEHGGEFLDALDAAGRDEPVRVMFIDLNMPGVSGFELLESLAERDLGDRILKFVLTTSAAPEDIARAYACGANAYFQKPMGLRGLREVIETVKALVACSKAPIGLPVGARCATREGSPRRR